MSHTEERISKLCYKSTS